MMQFEMRFSKGKLGQRMFVELIKEKMLQVFRAFAGSPEACVYLGSIFGIASVFCLRSIVAALVEMHRSKSKIKKLYNRYRDGAHQRATSAITPGTMTSK